MYTIYSVYEVQTSPQLPQNLPKVSEILKAQRSDGLDGIRQTMSHVNLKEKTFGRDLKTPPPCKKEIRS